MKLINSIHLHHEEYNTKHNTCIYQNLYLCLEDFRGENIAITFKFVNDIHILLADSGGVLRQYTNKIVLLLSIPNRIL